MYVCVQDEYGRLLTSRSLQLKGRPEVFALGDCSAVEGDKNPSTAQGAHAIIHTYIHLHIYMLYIDRYRIKKKNNYTHAYLYTTIHMYAY